MAIWLFGPKGGVSWWEVGSQVVGFISGRGGGVQCGGKFAGPDYHVMGHHLHRTHFQFDKYPDPTAQEPETGPELDPCWRDF